MTYETYAGASDVACLVPANDTQIGLIRLPSNQSIRALPTVGMPLYGVAKSAAAAELVQRLTLDLNQGQRLHGSDRLPQAVAAIIFDLLHAASFEPMRRCFRPMRSSDFIGKRITHPPAKRALDLLEQNGFIVRDVGRSTRRGFSEDIVTRFTPTEPLLRYVADFGITAANRNDHFVRQIDPVPITETIKLNAASRWCGNEKYKGKPLPVDFNDPWVMQMARRVTGINTFTFAQRIEGTEFYGFYRGFNLGNLPGHAFRKGGRLYACGGVFQQMARSDRSLIRINGEPTAEIDIGSSHLSIFLARTGVSFDPTADLYLVPGVPREVIKTFINLSITSPGMRRDWPAETVQDLLEANYPIDLRLYPIKEIRDICFDLHPILRERKRFPINWADIQFIESCVIIDCVDLLNQRGITALPIHDSLIVPSRFKEEASSILKERFMFHVGVEPRIK